MLHHIFAIAAALALAPASASAQSVYFGSLHAHTSYSDGSGTPEEAYRAARSAGLDFYALTEHNHPTAEAGAKDRADGRLIATDPQLYSGAPHSLRETADRMYEPGRFITLYGQEYSTISSGNHMNVFMVPEVITVPNGAYDQLAAWAARTRDPWGRAPLMQMNHPNDPARSPKDYGRDDFESDAAWVAAMDPLVQLIEVLSGPALKDGTGFRAGRHESQYLKYLDLGFHLAPSAGQDNHYRNWGVSSDARVAVIADRLTREDVMEALRNRRAYSSEDRNLKVIFRANGALQGDRVAAPPPGSLLALTLQLEDGDEPDARYRVEVLVDSPGDGLPATVVATTSFEGNSPAGRTLPSVPFGRAGDYVLLRITQMNETGRGGDRVLTAPVWFE